MWKFTTRPVLRGHTYAISSRKPQATQAAERILRAGGNAFDAAVAGGLALAVTDPAMTGLGGDACALIYSAETDSVVSINGAGTAPRLATIGWYTQNCGGAIPVNDGLLCASLPSFFDACYLLLKGWGVMSFHDVLQPAIELARHGFPISEHLSQFLSDFSLKLEKYPTSRNIYFPFGRPLKAGETLQNPYLARVLETLAGAEQLCGPCERNVALKAVRDRFYQGDIALAMADFIEKHGGLYRYDDFASYGAKVEAPISTKYKEYEIYKNRSANQGATDLLLLNLLEAYNLQKFGHNSVDYIHTCIEAAKLAYADREYLADLDFVDIPYTKLLSKSYAADRRALIDPERASLEFRPGALTEAPLALNLSGAANHEGDTSYLAVVDGNRNAVSFMPSLHSPFGTGVVLGDLGFMLNCRGDLYHLDPAHPNALVPTKRPRSTLTPSIVIRNGKPFMILGSPGADDQPLRVVQTFLNVVEFGMNIQEAIEAPRWSTTSFPASEFPHTMYPGQIAVEDRIPVDVRSALKERGHIVDVKDSWSLNATCAVMVESDTGTLHAGADPRGDSYALAW